MSMATQGAIILKPVATKKLVATTQPLITTTTVIKAERIRYDDTKIAERIPIEELKAGKHELPAWAEGLFDITPEGMPRRRRRLNHLSTEQKMLRRKLKNRVAAQNARDKKKTEAERLRIDNDDLRDLVKQMEHEAAENQSRLAQLEQENELLRERLGMSPARHYTSNDGDVVLTTSGSSSSMNSTIDSGCEDFSSSCSSSSAAPSPACVPTSSSPCLVVVNASAHTTVHSPAHLAITSGSPPAESVLSRATV